MTLKLYFNPRSRALIAKWLLDEAGVDYEIVPVDLQKKEHKTPAFRAINPAGKLPALVDGKARVFENPAIALYIAEKYPHTKLAPPLGTAERGRFLSLMVYATAQLEPSMGDDLLKLPTPAARGWNDFAIVKDVVERELGEGPYLFGAQFTAADVMVGAMFIWQRMMGRRSGSAKIDAYIDRLLARPHAMKIG
ncbi:glutathione S-transferase family protein [Variovorax sp. LT1R16]|uniref:glutathione S-transferase family protein n=1 Tax=Variovorax sp. LT1R16 TaxID=3443728 RepID=UPI003F46BD01